MGTRRRSYSREGLERADRVVRFIETLRVPSGVGAGGFFRLRPWQRDFIVEVYAPTRRGGLRQVRRAILSIGRKNGKTALIAALVLVHLVGPESIQNGEIYSAANDRAQAAQVYKMAEQIVRLDPELRVMLKCIDSTKRIVCYHNGSFYMAVSAEAGTKHGFNPTLVIYDELAQAKNRDLYDVLDTSMGARDEPLMVVISTQSNDPQHILSKLIDDGLSARDATAVCHLYAAPEGCEVLDKAAWSAANPALGDFRSLDDLEALARRAARMPAEEPKFRNLYLNQRVAPYATLIARADWEGCGDAARAELRPGERIWLALDMSARNDLTALAAVSAEDGDRVAAWFWKPEAAIDDHERRDRFPYRQMVAEGYIEAIEGRIIHPRAIVERIAELSEQFEVLGLAYDRWGIDQILREFDAVGLEAIRADPDPDKRGDGLQLFPWGQGFRDMAPAIDALEGAVLGGSLVQPENSVLTWCMANAIATTDPAGGRKLDKAKARFRIDGAQALAMALGIKARERIDEGAGLDDFLSSPVMVI